MAKIIPQVSNSLKKFWSQKYGENETIILTEYVNLMAGQFLGEKFTYKFCPTIDFNLKQMRESFPELKIPAIKKALLSLKRSGVIEIAGEIKFHGFLIFINHEELFQNLLYFGEASNV